MRPPGKKYTSKAVSFVAFPGGEIFVDGASVGRDATAPMRLDPGKHAVTVKNRFLGENTESIELKENDGKPSVLTLLW